MFVCLVFTVLTIVKTLLSAVRSAVYWPPPRCGQPFPLELAFISPQDFRCACEMSQSEDAQDPSAPSPGGTLPSLNIRVQAEDVREAVAQGGTGGESSQLSQCSIVESSEKEIGESQARDFSFCLFVSVISSSCTNHVVSSRCGLYAAMGLMRLRGDIVSVPSHCLARYSRPCCAELVLPSLDAGHKNRERVWNCRDLQRSKGNVVQ